MCTNAGHFLTRLITSGVIAKENFSEVGRKKVLHFLRSFKAVERRKLSNMADPGFFVCVSVMDVTRGQGDINLHVISGAVIEWMQKWRAVACCCCVPRLSSGVCIRARASAAQCGTGSVAAGVKVARAVNSLILSLPLPLIYFPFSLILVYAAAPSSFPS